MFLYQIRKSHTIPSTATIGKTHSKIGFCTTRVRKYTSTDVRMQKICCQHHNSFFKVHRLNAAGKVFQASHTLPSTFTFVSDAGPSRYLRSTSLVCLRFLSSTNLQP
jgi:hypothetical protein